MKFAPPHACTLLPSRCGAYTVDGLIDKAGDMVDEKTDGKFEGIVDKAQDALQSQTGDN